MKNKTSLRIISVLSAALVCAGAAAVTSSRAAAAAERAVRYQGQQAFSELCDAAAGLDTALQKTLYAVTPGMTASLCAEVYSRSQTAAAALSALPFPMQELEQTASFLSTAGDYAAFLLRRSGGGEELSDQDRENLRALSESAGLLAENLRQLQADAAAGLVDADASAAAEAGLPSLSDSFLQMEQEFPELPVLVYDGPFSSDVPERTPRMTENAGEVDEAAAALVASGFLGIRTNLASAQGSCDGKIPAWRISAGDYTVCVSRRGGYVVRAISARTPVRTVLSVEDGLKAAREFLARRRYPEMAESYHVLEGAALTVTFCAREGGAVCYPDMIKITVAMDNGELLRFDAESYLTCHGPRELPAPVLSREEAAAMIPHSLTLESQRLAVIPSDGTREIFCREMVCRTEDGRHCLVYFNAVTGRQERILLLLEDETGTLAV